MNIPTAKEAKEITQRNSTTLLDRMVEEARKRILTAASSGADYVTYTWDNKEFFEYKDRETMIAFKEKLTAMGYDVSFMFDICAYPTYVSAIKISWE